MKIKINGQVINVNGDEIEIEENEKQIIIKVIVKNEEKQPDIVIYPYPYYPYSPYTDIWYDTHSHTSDSFLKDADIYYQI